MLASITPLGERARGNRWRATAFWLLLGHLLGGLALGSLLAAAGYLLRLTGLQFSLSTSFLLLSLTVMAAAIYDLVDGRLPIHRQVNEQWLTSYRGWVYGLGFGVQLGLGFITVVNTALFVAVAVAGLLLPFTNALILGVVYGAVRGLTVCGSGGVRNATSLRLLHSRLDRWERPMRWTSVLVPAVLVVGLFVA